jgi:hypothetical protein
MRSFAHTPGRTEAGEKNSAGRKPPPRSDAGSRSPNVPFRSPEPAPSHLREKAVQETANEQAFPGSIHPPQSSGQPIPASTRSSFEQTFNYDFGRVRLHDDSEADVLSRSVSARAFTYGPDIFFQRGELASDHAAGEQLLAHELAHVVQQHAAGERRIQRQPDPRSQSKTPASPGPIPKTDKEYEAWMRTHTKGTQHVVGAWLGKDFDRYTPEWFQARGFAYAFKMYGGNQATYIELWVNNTTGDEYRVIRQPDRPKEGAAPKPEKPPAIGDGGDRDDSGDDVDTETNPPTTLEEAQQRANQPILRLTFLMNDLREKYARLSVDPPPPNYDKLMEEFTAEADDFNSTLDQGDAALDIVIQMDPPENPHHSPLSVSLTEQYLSLEAFSGMWLIPKLPPP